MAFFIFYDMDSTFKNSYPVTFPTMMTQVAKQGNFFFYFFWRKIGGVGGGGVVLGLHTHAFLVLCDFSETMWGK